MFTCQFELGGHNNQQTGSSPPVQRDAISMSSPDDLQAGPGFFTLRSVRPSEVDDGDSYVFVDPDSPSLTVGDASAHTVDKTRPKSRQKLVTAVWTWGLLLIFVVCLTVLPFVSVALFGTNFSPQPGLCQCPNCHSANDVCSPHR